MKKIFCLICCAILFTSCGKKSGLNYPGGQDKPDYDKVLEGGKQ